MEDCVKYAWRIEREDSMRKWGNYEERKRELLQA
jgi:hypothetical protein